MTVIDEVRTFTANGFAEFGRRGSLECLLTPFQLDEDRCLELYVEEVADGHFKVSDRGQVAELLADQQVDLGSKSNFRSWAKVLADLPAVAFAEEAPFEIAATTARDTLAQTIVHVGQVSVRASGLAVLGKAPARNWRETLIKRAKAKGLVVHPNATIPNRFGGHRKVSFQIEHGDRSAAVLARRSGEGGYFNDSYDRILGVFSGAEIPLEDRIALTDDDAKIEPWHMDGLARVCLLKREREQDELWAALAA